MTQPETIILRELLDREPGFVSGSALAKKLGMSRVGIWSHMEKLRTQGFAFKAVRSRGYRLARSPATLNLALIEAHLRRRARGFALAVFDEIDSTNDEAERQLASGRPAPFAVLARRQTRGRGRFGRSWHSEANGNFYASFAFRPRLEPARMQTFTLWMGVNICELVANFCHLAPGLKWPNDLVFAGRKAGGMLTEARVDADQIRDLVFGLGLNVNASRDAWPRPLAATATSLAEQTGAPLDLNRFAAALIGRVLLAYTGFVEGDHEPLFADLWSRYDVLRGQPIVLVQGEKKIPGTAAGIDGEGSLLLRADTGKMLRFRAGEVTLAKNPELKVER
ncbi:MAG: biotin--[acetyl-CoA-carboxylase] ligase [Opitutaceae bacterium]|jgi:BirA family biotin operon repressor/biotin-[acetyl-CoA-carboxylase] ligase